MAEKPSKVLRKMGNYCYLECLAGGEGGEGQQSTGSEFCQVGDGEKPPESVAEGTSE